MSDIDYLKNGKPVVCVDFDGVIATYDGDFKNVFECGEPIHGIHEFMAALREWYYVVVFTARCNPDINPWNRSLPEFEKLDVARQYASFIGKWLQDNKIEYDEVYCGVGKPIAKAYIDDRSVYLERNPTRGDFDLARYETDRLVRYKG